MARRIALVLASSLLLAGSAWGHGSSHDQKEVIDAKIARLQDRIAEANRREGVLTSEISAVTSKIRSLQGAVETSSARVDRLESELAAYEERLAALTELYRVQTTKLKLMRQQHAIAQRRLEERLVAIYESDDPNAIEVMLSAARFSDVLDQLDYVNQLGELDRSIARHVARAKEDVRAARARTERTRTGVARAAEAIRVRAAAQRAETSRLVSTQPALAGARQEKRATLAAVNATEREYLHEVEGLEQASAALAARIQALQAARAAAPTSAAPAASTGGPSPSGFVWPVAGPVTSTFGWRWGRMHEGIDIAAPAGSPIGSAAAGTVIYAGWMSGYGNLVVVDHGGGVATAYAHMSSIGASVGQAVGRGQTIGYVGCTGNCYGDHLHFEVRVNGAAVDPLGYL